MLRLKLSENYQKLSAIRVDYYTFVSIGLLMLICLYPDISFAEASIDGQFNKVGVLAGKGRTIGITVASIIVFIGAMVKSSPKIAFTALGIAVLGALFSEWVAGGMKLGSA